MAEGTRPRRRRQARGEQRIAQIIDAAADVFARHGYEGTTTVKISAAAGISPGSLYQFFPNKEAIAKALADRYVTELAQAHEAVFRGVDLASLDLPALIDQVVDPLVAFNIANPGFQALYARPDQPAALTEAAGALDKAVLGRIIDLFAARAPHLTAAEATLTAQIGGQIFKALIPMVVSSEGEEREAAIRETKRAIHAYLASVLGERQPARGHR
ncbi:TetR/AcrR family transcriptional regulator [Streptomyces sp. 6N223]|uniref:TetR/AcrR family transcriptional regulator n=1 Tax=Streptomyces sp. 6N223 TaxID=3457412 RepID=UPI003FD1209C